MDDRKHPNVKETASSLAHWMRRTASCSHAQSQNHLKAQFPPNCELGDLGNGTRSMSRAPVHMKSVSIGEKVVAGEEQRLSVRFNQRFLVEIQMRQKSGSQVQLKVRKNASISFTELNLAPEAEIRETKKEKCQFPPKSQPSKPKKAMDTQQIGLLVPAKSTNASIQRLNTALLHLRLRYRLLPHPKAKEIMPFNLPLSTEVAVSQQQELPSKAKEASGKVNLAQCAPYRVAVDFNMYRNVRKLAAGRLRALFDNS